MSLNKDYETIRNKALNGFITRDLFPYLFEYYREKKAHHILIHNYNDFSRYFSIYLNTPIFYEDMVIQPIDELRQKLPIIFETLNKKYAED